MIDSDFDFQELGFEVADKAVFASKGIYLSDLQKLVLKASWQGQTYEQMARDFGYSDKYLKRDVGPKLWKLLSESLGEVVSKNNFRMALQRHLGRSRSDQLEDNNHENQLPSRSQYWGEVIDVANFYGRQDELTTLEQWAVNDQCRLLTLLGIAGVGKTALAAKLVEQVAPVYEFLIWSSLRNAPRVEDLLEAWLQRLCPALPVSVPETTEARAIQLVQLLRQHRCLLVLDNIETVLKSGDSTGQYCDGYEGYGLLLRYIAEAPHQSCLLLTSREQLRGLASREGEKLPIRSYAVKGLKMTAGQMLLQAKGLVGSEDASRRLVKLYAGNPLALKIAATTIQNVFDGQIVEFLDQGHVMLSGVQDLLDQQFGRLSDLEKKIMYWLAVEGEPISLKRLQENLGPQVRLMNLSEAIESLLKRSLIRRCRGKFTQQPMVMEYMIERMSHYYLDHSQQLQRLNSSPEPLLYAS